jgi:hypothetical protein
MGRGPEGDLPDCTRWEWEERVPEWKRRAGVAQGRGKGPRGGAPAAGCGFFRAIGNGDSPSFRLGVTQLTANTFLQYNV